MKKIFLLLGVIGLAITVFIIFKPTSETVEKRAQMRASAPTENPENQPRKPEKKTLHIDVTINDAHFRRLSYDIPLYITLRLSNPLAERSLTLKKNSLFTPFCKGADGIAVAMTTQPLTVLPTEQIVIPKNSSATIAWKLTTSLAPGNYDIGVTATNEFIDLKSNNLDRIKSRSAYLELVNTPASRNEKEYYLRRVLSLQGKPEQVLALLQKALIVTPDNPALRLEIVETLEETGNFQQARQELINLAQLVQNQQAKKSPHSPPHLPFRIINRDKRLQDFLKLQAAHSLSPK